MSTIWEMANAIRAEEARALCAAPTRCKEDARRASVEVGPPGAAEFWCKFFGTTPMRLCCAIDQVGHEPDAVRRFLSLRATA